MAKNNALEMFDIDGTMIVVPIKLFCKTAGDIIVDMVDEELDHKRFVYMSTMGKDIAEDKMDDYQCPICTMHLTPAIEVCCCWRLLN